MTLPVGGPKRSNVAAEELARDTSGLSVVLAILLILIGILDILLPFKMARGIVLLMSWLLMISGVVQFFHAFRCQGIGHGIWRALIALIYLATGLYLRVNRGLAVSTLALVLVSFLVAQGLVDILVYFRTRKSGISHWLLLDGFATLVLGLIMWRYWPTGSLLVIAILVGVNMIVTGTTRLMLTLAMRRTIKSAAPSIE